VKYITPLSLCLALLPPLPYRVFLIQLITTNTSYELCPTFFWVENDRRNRSLEKTLFFKTSLLGQIKTMNFEPHGLVTLSFQNDL
jgi:hypothetical protein